VEFTLDGNQWQSARGCDWLVGAYRETRFGGTSMIGG